MRKCGTKLYCAFLYYFVFIVIVFLFKFCRLPIVKDTVTDADSLEIIPMRKKMDLESASIITQILSKITFKIMPDKRYSSRPKRHSDEIYPMF